MTSLDDLLGPASSGSPGVPPPQAASTGSPTQAQANPNAQPARAAATPPPGLTQLDRLLNDGMAKDKNTGENIPLKYSGNTPDTAQNKSPLSAYDRMKLSLGNEAGNLQYLHQRFQDVKQIAGSDGKPTKELAVLDKGTWYRVNPVNGDIADPWEKTKEYMTDAATFAPEAIGVGAAVGAGALAAATGGASIPATAALAGMASGTIRTSLGRLVGTYDATPQEQAWDIGFEGLLNAAGVKIMAGVKPTAGFIAKNMSKLADFYADTMPQAVQGGLAAIGNAVAGGAKSAVNLPKTAFRQLFSQFSVGDRSFEKMVMNQGDVSGAMQYLQAASEGDAVRFHDKGNLVQLDSVKNIADQTQSTISKIYGGQRNKLLSKVPDNFSVNLDEPINSAYADAVKKGLGAITVGGKQLEGQAAEQYIAENGMGKASFNLFSQEDMQRRIAAGAKLASDNNQLSLGLLGQDKEAHGVVQAFYDRLGTLSGGVDRTGKAGAQDLLDFNKVTTNLVQSLQNTEAAQQSPGVSSILMDGKKAIFDSVSGALKKAGPGLEQDLATLNNTHVGLVRATADMLAKRDSYMASDNLRAMQPVLNDILGPKGAITRNAVETMIQAADQNGLSAESAALKKSLDKIDIFQAAKDFNPIKPGTLKADSSSSPLIQMAKNATAAPFRSPNVAMGAAGVESLTRAGVQGLWNAQQMLLSLPKAQLSSLMNDPVAMNKYLTGITAAPSARAGAQATMQGILQQVQQGQQGQQ